MKLEFLGERELISAVRKEFAVSCEDLILGIGDDAAVIKVKGRNIIVTKDLLIEDFHFTTTIQPPYFLGRKSLNVNLSDVAAMGGKPRYAFLGLGVPSKTQPEWLEKYFAGLKSASREWDVGLAGGDLSESKKIFISVTVLGEGQTILPRGGGRSGHFLFVSGTLGDSKQGLLLLKKGYRLGDDKEADPFLKAFLDPAPQIPLALELSRLKLASSLIDLSDGLSMDLFNLCQESGCGAEIEKESLPLSHQLRQWQMNPYELALHGGEDYQLLFSIPPENMKGMLRLEKKYRLTCIGKMVKDRGLYLIDKRGNRKLLKKKGYQHFKRGH